MQEVRLIDANAAAENADKRYGEWVLAMAAAAFRSIQKDEYQKEAARLDRIGDIVPPAAPDDRYRRV